MGTYDVLPASMKIDLIDGEAIHKLYLESTAALRQGGIVPSDFNMAIDQTFSGRDSLQLSEAERGILRWMFGAPQVSDRRRKS
ncbi:hypothetical protein BM221_005708 [Beauveria bassiana]|uniref:Uncharacterized protein n=1 Tax=Beauveria bassiana TaxID=176275 RepID=A0A2N6NPB9_BEABA|nr:hypothetical protein BM221_005708 [Beauveria bassiana]